MRRLVVELPPSLAARWSRRVAGFALLVTAMTVLLSRLDRLDVTASMAVLAGGMVLAAVAIALAVVAFGVVWDDGRPGFGAAMAGLLVAIGLLAYPSFLAVQALRLPRLNDITTDVTDPPAFSRSRRALDLRAGRIPPDPGPASRALQAIAYPELAPLTLELAPQEVYQLVLKAAQQRGWQVVETAAPGGRTGTGRIEAIDRSLLMRFPDDVTVRIRPVAVGARVDVRSASRFGAHDLGANARRIEAFLATLQELADERS
ncbi:DUF1499 domain-containing protein [Alsobacter sp. R-9]